MLESLDTENNANANANVQVQEVQAQGPITVVRVKLRYYDRSAARRQQESNASMASISGMPRNKPIRYRNGGMTHADAEHLAQKMWSEGAAIGQVRWRRAKTPRFWVGVCFTDGRRPETKGSSNVDWETAFAIAEGLLR